MMRHVVIAIAIGLSGCAELSQFGIVNQPPQIDYRQAWIGKSADDLDMHPAFVIMAQNRTMTESGVEIRDYYEGGPVSICRGGGFANAIDGSSAIATNTQRCNVGSSGCHTLFYLKDKKVIRQAWSGDTCVMDDKYLPEN